MAWPFKKKNPEQFNPEDTVPSNVPVNFAPQEPFVRKVALVDVPVRRILRRVLLLLLVAGIGAAGWFGYTKLKDPVAKSVKEFAGANLKENRQNGNSTSSGQNQSNDGPTNIIDLTTFKNRLQSIDDKADAAYDAAYAAYQDYIVNGEGTSDNLKKLTNDGIKEAQAAINTYSGTMVPKEFAAKREALEAAKAKFIETYQKRIEGYNAALQYIETQETQYFDTASSRFSESDMAEEQAVNVLTSV